MMTIPESDDHTQLAQEVVDPPQRSRKIERQRIKPQILADQIRPHQQNKDHRRTAVRYAQKIVVAERPDLDAIRPRVGKNLRAEESATIARSARPGRTFAPSNPHNADHQQPARWRAATPRAGPCAAQRFFSPTRTPCRVIASQRQACPDKCARPMLIALIENGHYVCSTASRNTSSSVLRCGRR